MMSKKKAAWVFACVAVAALLTMMSGGCGGGRGSRASAPVTAPEGATGYGKVAAMVKLKPPAWRVADAAGSSTVTVTITVSGAFGTGPVRKEFKPVVSTAVLDINAGPQKVSVLSVPTGLNHLLTVVADWGGATDTIKAIAPEVKEGETETILANEATTAAADAAMYFAQQNNKKLYELPREMIMKISAAVEQMAASGVPFSQMQPGGVIAFMGNMGAPVGMAITPASATVVVGGQTQFMAAALDGNGLPVPGATATWAFSAPAVGSVSNVGMFTGAATGTGVVTASFASFTATAAVTVISVCASDQVCNDNNPLTIDMCQNPGLVIAQCLHNAISCAIDADCNDNNPQTSDVCMGGGTPGAACSHSPVVNQPPAATATADVTGGISPLTVNFTGACSDPDGTCVSYAWNFGDGSATATMQNPAHIYTASGAFAATLVVTDNQGASAVSAVTVTVAGNQAPVGSAAADTATGTAPLTVNFTGGCTDPDGSCVSYLWNFGDGSPTISSQNPSHTFASSGAFTVTLTVTDNLGATNQRTLVVNVNQPPAASASAAPQSGPAPLAVAFTGGCADSDGTCVSYAWNFGDGSATATAQNASHTYTATGTYIARLTVTDNLGAVGMSAATVSVAVNILPAGTIASDVASGTAPLPVSFTGGCTDADGSCVSYLWNFGDGSPTVSTQSASHVYAAGGTFTVTLTVTDNLGASSQRSVVVNVNNKPVAAASANVSNGIAPLTVNFTGGCTDSDGTCASYSWAFGDGASSTAQNPSHTYNATGTFSAVLSVKDNLNATATSAVTITVVANQPPVATAGSNVSNGVAPLTVNFTGGCTDADGTCVSYSWNFMDGSATNTTQNPSHTFTATGSFNVVLTVTDNLGAAAQSVRNISVGSNQLPVGSIGASPATGTAPLPVNFTGGCTDADGTCVSYLWNFGDGSPTVSTQNASHTYAVGGAFTVTLTVTDNLGAATNTTTIINVNNKPTAGAAANFTSGIAPLAVTFTGTCSDSDGTCASYSWEFGDGSATATTQNASHTYTATGTFNAELKVTDNSGAWATSAVTITVVANQPPVASATSNFISGIAPLNVNFTGNCTDPDGTCVSYSWNFGDGSATNTTQNPSHTYTATGTFNATLTVTDNMGATAQTVRTVTVVANQLPSGSISTNVATGTVPLNVNFTGNCTDADGTCVSYLWNFGDGAPTVSTQNASHTYNTAGSFVVTFTVTDSNGATSFSTAPISVAAAVTCGNGAIEPGEFCDDSNLANGDGCSDSCFREFQVAQSHVCILNYHYAGGVECWGANNVGQLGDGTTVSRTAAAAVTGLASGVKQISAGVTATCVVTNAGGVKCWGQYIGGSPVDVAGLASGVKMVAAGTTAASCALMDTGTVKCWGDNPNGELGNGTFTGSSTPVDVTGLTNIAAVVTGSNYACALTNAGGVKCWGYGASGNLGNGSLTNSNVPVDVTGLTTGVREISVQAGVTTCALTTGGGVKCWGYNADGQVGNGTTGANQSTPVDVTGLTSGVSAITSGYNTACALTSGGGIKCWGYNFYGMLGDGTTTSRSTPVDVTGMTTGLTVPPSLGVYNGGVRKPDGSLYWWGNNTFSGVRIFASDSPLTATTPILINLKPVGTLSASPASGTVPINVNFTGNCTDADGTCVSYLWDFGDGSPTVSTSNTSHTYNTAGMFVATFTVTDNNGASSFSTASISVSPSSVCGNNIPEPGEECDDGNVANGDGCSQYCLSELAVSMEHVCAINRAYDGGVECWGRNHLGQLGDGTTTNRSVPTAVPGLTSGVKQVVAGNSFACVLTTAGGVKCWGVNANGELGIGNLTNQLTPMDVTGLASGVKQISAGTADVCAVMNTGGVKCWGLNNYGQIGNGGGADVTTPVDVPGLTNVAYVATGENFTCALSTTGGVKCWGRGNIGSLGDGTWGGSTTPVNVLGLTSGVAMISTGSVSSQAICALTTAGGVKCWGENLNGGIGDGTTADKNSPTDVVGLTSGMKGVGVGYLQSCGITTSGAAKCWGNNAYGTLGDGTNTHSSVPVNVAFGPVTISTIKASRTLTGARATTGEIYLWGDNSLGQYGNGGTAASNVPVTFAVSKFSSNGSTTCVVTGAGGLKCWGNNANGQLGDGTTTNRSTPGFVSGLSSGVLDVSVGTANHVCALTAAGGIVCWGQNTNGELGNGTTTDSTIPVNVTGLGSGVLAFESGFEHNCAITTAGGLKCWGMNAYNEIGDGSGTTRTTPVDVTGFTTGASRASGRAWHNCLVTTAGGVKCWGEGYPATPTDVSGLASGVLDVKSGYNSDCALMATGGVKCWGNNGSGQLGDGTNTNSIGVPVDVVGLSSGVVAITMTWRQACALLNTGGVKCWGENGNGQLGNGTTANSNVPVDVTGLTSGVKAIYTGGSSPGAATCAAQGGALKCWGYNLYGQLGDGTTTQRLTPVNVLGF